ATCTIPTIRGDIDACFISGIHDCFESSDPNDGGDSVFECQSYFISGSHWYNLCKTIVLEIQGGASGIAERDAPPCLLRVYILRSRSCRHQSSGECSHF